jgi:acetyl esterase/lipase
MGSSRVRGSVRAAYIARRLWLQFAVAGYLFSTATVAAAQPSAVELRADVAYGPRPQEVGDVYLPPDPKNPRAAVIVIHGGGWIEGSRKADDGLSRLIAAQGLVVFDIDYRLADKAKPDTRWPAQLVDAQLAVRFLRAHAEEFSVDPARIGALGDSAGAQLAVFLGVLPRVVAGAGSELYPDQKPDVMAVVDQFGPTDLAGMGSAGARSIDAMFGIAAPTGQALLTASPLPSVTAHSAPVYILHGEKDDIVPFQQSRQLADTLRAHDVKTELVPFAGGHEYEGMPPEDATKLQMAAVKWLVEKLR